MSSARMRRSWLTISLTTVVTISAVLAVVLVPSSRPAEAQDVHGTLQPVSLDGLGNPNNYGFHRLYEFQGYLWATSGNTAEGTIIYRSRDGEDWEAVSPPGIDGDLANDSIVSLGWFKGANDPPGSKGKLYAATYSFRATSNQNGGDIWRANADAEDPDDIVWENITKDAFGDPRRQAFVGFVVFKDHLYAGTFNNESPEESGSEIFRTATGDADDWQLVAPKGMGDPQCNTDFHLNIVYGDHVYFGSEEAGCFGSKGGEIWRTDGNLTPPFDTLDGWEKVTSASGFGDPANFNVFGMDIFQGHFYAATWRLTGMEVFRAPVLPPHEGVTEAPFDFEQVSQPGFGDARNTVNVGMVHLGDTLYVAGVDWFGRSGGYLYRTNGGANSAEHIQNWTEVTAPGFPPAVEPGTNPLQGPFWLEVFKGKIYAGVERGGQGDATGPGQLWVYEPANVPVLGVTAATSCVIAGEQVTISGTGFDDYQGEAYPVLDGTSIPVVKWTDTEIVALIPAGSVSGPLAVYRDGETSNAKHVNVLPDGSDVVTGQHTGPLTIADGVTCLDDATQAGPVTVQPGAGLVVQDSRVTGPIRAQGATEVTMCGTRVTGPITLRDSSLVTFGNPDAACGPNTITGPVNVSGTSGLSAIAGNRIIGPLACTSNTPPPVNNGHPNRVTGPRTGQCANL